MASTKNIGPRASTDEAVSRVAGLTVETNGTNLCVDRDLNPRWSEISLIVKNNTRRNVVTPGNQHAPQRRVVTPARTGLENERSDDFGVNSFACLT
eukprot:394869-Prorocentrum_minimum.AAC.5